jgi:hypothetical protein
MQTPSRLHRGSEIHLTGGVSAESSFSCLGSKDREVARSGRPGTRLRGNLVPGLHPAGSSRATVRSRFARTLQDALSDLGYQHAPLTFGSKHPVEKVPGMDSVTPLVVSVIATSV